MRFCATRSKRAVLVDRQNTIRIGHVTHFMGQNPALRFGLGLHHCGSTRKSEIEFRIEPRRSRLPYSSEYCPIIWIMSSWPLPPFLQILVWSRQPYLLMEGKAMIQTGALGCDASHNHNHSVQQCRCNLCLWTIPSRN